MFITSWLFQTFASLMPNTTRATKDTTYSSCPPRAYNLIDGPSTLTGVAKVIALLHAEQRLFSKKMPQLAFLARPLPQHLRKRQLLDSHYRDKMQTPTRYVFETVLISNCCFDSQKSPAGPTKMVRKLRGLCLGGRHMICIPISCPGLAMTRIT